MLAKAEQCVALPAKAEPQPVQIAAAPPSFTLDHQTYVGGESIEVHFQSPISSPEGSRAWLTTADAASGPTAYGNWEYVPDHAHSATIKAPEKPGNYQVRLHTEYPKKSTNLVFSVGFTVADNQAPPPPKAALATPTPLAQQRFTVLTPTIRAGGKVDIRFPTPMVAVGAEQFWVTIVAKGAADSAYGSWEYLPAGARTMTITAPTTGGDYEVRLHANYPTKTTNLVFRAPLRVEP